MTSPRPIYSRFPEQPTPPSKEDERGCSEHMELSKEIAETSILLHSAQQFRGSLSSMTISP